MAAYLKSGGRDSVGAVAMGLVERVKARRVPDLSKQVHKAIEELGWEDLNQLGAGQTAGFDAGLIVRDVRGSVNGWGTDEGRLFKALTGRTRVQIAAMRKAYKHFYERDMDDDINSDVTGSEQDRADALLSGDATAGAVATLRDAVSGASTDENTIMQTLRGTTPAERDAILAAYQKTFGVELRTDLADDMATATNMFIKQDMKGGAYGGEDIAIDLAQRTAEALVAAATAGMGEAALKMLARSPAFAAMIETGQAGRLELIAVKGAESGIEGRSRGFRPVWRRRS